MAVVHVIKSPTPKTTLTEYDRQLVQGVPFLQGKELSLTTTATAATQRLPHGLGRPYRGGWQVSTSGTSRLIVLDPTLQPDPETNVAVQDSAAAAGTTTIWIF